MYIVSYVSKDSDGDVSFGAEKLFNNYDKAVAFANEIITEKKRRYIADMVEDEEDFDPEGCFEEGSYNVFYNTDEVHRYLEIYSFGDVIGTLEVKVNQLTEPDD